MKKYYFVLLVLSFSVFSFDAQFANANDAGCFAGAPYSNTTGRPCVTQTIPPGSTPAQAPATSNSISASRELSLGSKGIDVKTLQEVLKNKGYYTGKADGSYGPMTRDAVKSFQAGADIVATGIADTATISKMNNPSPSTKNSSFIPVIPNVTPTTPSSPKYSPVYITSSSTLQSGRTGSFYSTDIVGSGGSGSYSWRITSGAVPRGMKFYQHYPPCASDAALCPVWGRIAGVPTHPGTSVFLVEITAIPLAGAGPGPTLRATKQFTLTVR